MLRNHLLDESLNRILISRNHYSNNIVITDSDFILTERTCAIAITADVSFKTALAADFKESTRISSFCGNRGRV